MRAGELAEYDVEQSNRRGVLFASGLIVGESLIGVIIAVLLYCQLQLVVVNLHLN